MSPGRRPGYSFLKVSYRVASHIIHNVFLKGYHSKYLEQKLQLFYTLKLRQNIRSALSFSRSKDLMFCIFSVVISIKFLQTLLELSLSSFSLMSILATPPFRAEQSLYSPLQGVPSPGLQVRVFVSYPQNFAKAVSRTSNCCLNFFSKLKAEASVFASRVCFHLRPKVFPSSLARFWSSERAFNTVDVK